MLKFESTEFSFEEVTESNLDSMQTATLQKVVSESEPLSGSDTSKASQTPSMQVKGITLHKCPKCEQQTLKIENGCNSCMNTDCGYGKCE
ncbi:MAG: hypothetical protein Q7S92_06435 [Candidatus Diapherotrites archaeon]|nr:hypothetical protein [Candidatus Diapherotrites archaeon]